MKETETLALILGVIHVWESFVVVKNGSVVLRGAGVRGSLARGGMAPDAPGEMLPALRASVVYASVLPPFGPVLALQPWPLSMSAEGVLPWIAPGPGRAAAAARPVLIPWDALRAVDAQGPLVVAGGREVALCVSEAESALLADLLERIAAAAPEARADAIRDAVRARYGRAAAESRIDAVRRRLPALLVATNALFVVLAALVLALAGVHALRDVWPWFLAAFLPAHVTTVVLARRAHATLHPRAVSERRKLTWISALAPLTAVRAAQAVARDALAGTEPSAAVRVLCDEEAARRFAQRTLADLRTPAMPSEPSDDAAARRVAAWFHAELRAAHEEWLRAEGTDPDALLAPPERRGRASPATYCPRCRAVYELASGTCRDCGGVPLVAFA
ncbi:MAG: hypothetical protein HMLKMBBP_01267 [Planctomycetes bacterium]|nr:hypothetical protein [Planctomycetota bacterium]